MSPDPLLMLTAALAGYLIGAVSFARIIASRAESRAELGPVSQQVPGTDVTFVMNTVSATAVNAHVGKKEGCLTALLDMIKVMIPTLVARFAFPGQPYYLIVAGFGVVGHNWPVYYRFKGGRGESPIIGGILAIDPLGLIAVNTIAAVAGIILGSMLVLRWSGFLLLIPWEWYTTHDIGRVVYVAAVLLMYVMALRSELGQYIRLKRDRVFLSQEVIAETISMGKPLGRFMDRYSLFALWRRWRHPGDKEVSRTSSGPMIPLFFLLLGASCIAAAGASAQTVFEGQASLLEQLRATAPRAITSDLRYLPMLSARTSLDDERVLSGEFSAHLGYRMINATDQRPRFEHTAELYRAWGRLAGEQWEARIGLQKISFGSAVIFRPLMWFDRLDPRDPLQITDGVPAFLARYSFLNNTNLWAWAVLGEGVARGWEVLPSPKGKVEFGGRAQFPLFTGEGAVSFHHRTADLKAVLPPFAPPVGSSMFSEDRLGIDGKWDVGVGLWGEASLTRQQTHLLGAPWQRMLTFGVDYSFAVAQGLQLLAEYAASAAGATAFGRGPTSNLLAVTGSLGLGLLDNLSAMLYLDLRRDDAYSFLDWRRTYDAWVFHLIGYANPAAAGSPDAQGIPGWQSRSTLAGRGVQLLVLFNH